MGPKIKHLNENTANTTAEALRVIRVKTDNYDVRGL